MGHPHSAHPHPVIGGDLPLSGLVPFQSFTRASPCYRDADFEANFYSTTPQQSFRGLFPFSVFPTTRSHIPPTPPMASGTLRPQGFSPSRRFTPRVISRAYFIPVPLLGFTLRGVSPSVAPYVLSDIATFLRFPLSSISPKEKFSPNAPLQGLARYRKHHHGFEVNRVPRGDCLLEFGSFEASCPSGQRTLIRRSPLVLFRLGRKLTESLAPQGFFQTSAIRLSRV